MLPESSKSVLLDLLMYAWREGYAFMMLDSNSDGLSVIPISIVHVLYIRENTGHFVIPPYCYIRKTIAIFEADLDELIRIASCYQASGGLY
jgi:hypothetical protein